MFKVKNKLEDVRKFRDSFIGKDIYVSPGESVLTNRPPQDGDVWEVKKVEEKKPVKIKKEEKKEDD